VKHLLCKVPIFAGLEEPSLKLLLEHAQKADFPAGTVITREGDTNDCFYIVENGQVRIVKNFGTPDPVMLAELRPGDFFGEMCFLETLPRSATAQAVGQTTAVSLTPMAMFHLYKKSPQQYAIIILNMARDLSRRLRRLDEIFAARH
jgi:CRP/FNR family transcriptional regulator, cyclic AMP receptor protein